MASTTREEFNSVTQSGPYASWSNLSNLVYPESGEATANMTTSSGSRTNIVAFGDHEGISAIPNGAQFESMSLQKNYKKGGTFQAAADVDIIGQTNLSSGLVWQNSNISNSYSSTFSSGDRTYWKLTGYSTTEIIDKLKDGSLTHQIWYKENNSVSSGTIAYLKEVSLVVTYTNVSGERGAILIPL